MQRKKKNTPKEIIAMKQSIYKDKKKEMERHNDRMQEYDRRLSRLQQTCTHPTTSQTTLTDIGMILCEDCDKSFEHKGDNN
jgi:hypothetical protein